jgi:hypothetical protein
LFDARKPASAASAASARKEALRHPTLAVATALAIDRGPSAETRAAAAKDPYWAAMYALHVDRAPRKDTREAARRRADGAVAYAKEIDLAADPEVRALMIREKDWWDASSADGFLEQLNERNAEYRGGGATKSGQVATRDLPRAPARPVSRFLEKGKGPVKPLSKELREDVDAMAAVGFEWLSLSPDASPSEVIDAVHAAIGALQAGERKLPLGKKRMQVQLGLACALADGFHRGLGWQWASVDPGGVASIVSPNREHGIVPLTPIRRLLAKGARANTLALMFNMAAAGNLPPPAKGKVVFVS